MAVKLLICDLDGTLIDSAADISAAVNYALGTYAISPVTLEQTKACVGEGISTLIEKILVLKGATVPDKESLVQRVLRYYAAHPVANTVPYPGVRETVAALAACKKAVISNKLTALAQEILRALDLLRYFAIVAGADSSLEQKPSPVPVLRVLSLLDVGPEETLMVGDSIYDMMAARAAGIRTVAVTYGYGKESFSEGCDYVIDRFSELLEIVQSSQSNCIE